MRRDYLQAHIKTMDTKWVTDMMARGRRIALRGVAICLTQHGDKFSMSPSIPCISPALRLLKQYPTLTDITWTGKKWKPTRVEIGQRRKGKGKYGNL